MVVGGGLTSAHVVSIALQQGAGHVTWVMRKYLQVRGSGRNGQDRDDKTGKSIVCHPVKKKENLMCK